DDWLESPCGLAGGLDEPFEERPELAGSIKVFGVPLHAETETLRGVLDCFDHAVGRGRAGHESFAERGRRLMMPAVDGARVPFELFAHECLQQAPTRDPHIVGNRVRRLT